MTWKKDFEKGREIVLATSSKENIPNINIVLSLGFINNKLLVADFQMDTTINNLKENKNICVLGGYTKLKGTVEIFKEGEIFDLCVNADPEMTLKHAILITINEVFDLDAVAKIE